MFIIHQVLTAEEVAECRNTMQNAAWIDGISTAGSLAKNVKQNLQLDDATEPAISLRNRILRKLANHPAFISYALPEKIYPPKFNCYCNGGFYGTHIDSAVMPVPGSHVSVRGDLSATLFLCDPDEYEGGELEIETVNGTQQIKLSAGDMVVYPSGSLHRVLPVTAGARYASFFWIESQIRDVYKRDMLYQLDCTIQNLSTKILATDAELIRLTGHYHNLLRLWSGT